MPIDPIAPRAEFFPVNLRQLKTKLSWLNLTKADREIAALKEQFRQPFQCAYLNGRPAILVCPNDYGCYWEVSSPPTALNPLGNSAHSETTPSVQKNRELVYQISINWLFYALTH